MSSHPSNSNKKNYSNSDSFIATVRDLASDGRGIVSHPNGLTVFVPGVWVGEECRVVLKEVRNKMGIGQALEIIKASNERISPQCPHHGFQAGDCGGCPWQFIEYSEQIKQKQQKVIEAFSRLGFTAVKDFLPSPQQFHYRNRAQLKTDGKAIGYLSGNSHTLAAINACEVLSKHNQETLSGLLQQLPNKQWHVKKSPRRPSKRKQAASFTSLNIDDSLNAEQVVVNKRLPFQQSHSDQNTVMQDWLSGHLKQVKSNGPVLELFCGAGNFTEVIANSIDAEIVAVEGDDRALQVLNEKQLNSVETFHCDLFTNDCFEKIYNKRRDFTVLVLDPPRDGLKNTQHLLRKKSTFESVFYISCNLATLCRDLNFFIDHGFAINDVQALDLSPHTPHIELLVRLDKK